MKHETHASLRKLVLSGLFTAVIFVLTAFLPIPLGHGYANAGDTFIILSGIVLGPWAAAAVSGIASAAADLYLGYSLYAPATLLIKALMGMSTGVLNALFAKKSSLRFHVSIAAIGLTSEGIMVLGYFLFETIAFGAAIAFADVAGNLMQAAFAVVLSFFMYSMLRKTGILNELQK